MQSKKRKMKSEKKLLEKSRNRSIKEGIFQSIKEAVGSNYISPLAIAINSSNTLVAMLSSVQGLLGPLSQLFGSKLIEKNPRKKIITKTVFLEILLWIPLLAISIFYYLGIIQNILPTFLFIFFSLYIIAFNLGHPAWFSWMGDIVDEKFRGRWFSKRNLYINFILFVFAISAAIFMDYFKNENQTMIGFAILFSIAILARITSWKILKQQYEPKIKIKKGTYFSFWEFLATAGKSNFGRFAIFRLLFSFAIGIGSSVMAIYLLRYLEFNYLNYILIIFSASIFHVLVIELWGKIADNYGNYIILVITTAMIPLIPIVWILSPKAIYLALIPGFIRGVSWAGFNLAAGNFIYDNVEKEKRGLAISYFNLLMGIGLFLGAGLGALLIKFLNTTWIEPIIFIFIISAIARMVVVFWWMPKIKETKKMKKFTNRSFRKFLFKQTKPTIREELSEISHIKEYLWER